MLGLFLVQFASCVRFRRQGFRVHREAARGAAELDLWARWSSSAEGFAQEPGFFYAGSEGTGPRALLPRAHYVPARFDPAPRFTPPPPVLVERNHHGQRVTIALRSFPNLELLSEFPEARPRPDTLGDRPIWIDCDPQGRPLGWYAPWRIDGQRIPLGRVPLRAVDLRTGEVVFEDIGAGAWSMELSGTAADPHRVSSINRYLDQLAEEYGGDPRSMDRQMPGLLHAFSRDGRWLVIGEIHRSLRLYDLATWARVGEITLPAQGRWLEDLFFDPSTGHLIASGRSYGHLEMGLGELRLSRGATR